MSHNNDSAAATVANSGDNQLDQQVKISLITVC